jgi:hypothetical protein
MFAIRFMRPCLGAAALFSAALMGCESAHKKSCDQCQTCNACAVASTPAVPAKPAASAVPATPAMPMPTGPAAPTTVPTPNIYGSLPPVSNERYIAPQQPNVVIAQKPPLDFSSPLKQEPRPALPEPKVVPVEPQIVPPAPKAVEPEPKAAEPEHQVTTAPVSPEVTPLRRSFPDITARPEFAHSADYSSLTGTLSFIPQKNQWRLRFASIDEEDRYGGSVTLEGGSKMSDYHDGQIVKVGGAIVDKESREPAPLFRVSDVTPVK